ncbi:glucose-6-phosphate dehydrogenase assembly protein OpcA [Prochlorococcus sp. MIT 1307]|uniref:glucose-6-phosphate dehydrogenase assembly protein OpcA n=1 Tax=Prochlorococcus sp. MIT 1307 TaxID=3096219 RepID=UPI002A7635C6|nr:glucose-6-phosphate dehydrogenase assembly protein OpcA [Prochlorococcus sp. MIT 1307]
MSPQLTLHTPLQIPPSEIPSYLKQLWSKEQLDSSGATTFCLLVWQPAWIEQELVRTGKIKGPIVGNQRRELIEAARTVVLDSDLPHCTPPLDKSVATSLSTFINKEQEAEDLRGQYVDVAISALNPRRLITLAPTLKKGHPLETLVAAYCPLLDENNLNAACGDVVVLRGDQQSLNKGLKILKDLLPNELPSWLWWNGNLDEAPELLHQLAIPKRRLIIDTALGEPIQCLELLTSRISSGQSINDLNWLRLRNWRETLAMVFDPPNRRDALNHVIRLDIDIEGNHPVQGLLLAAWIAERLNWELKSANSQNGEIIKASFQRVDGEIVQLCLIPLPVGTPSIHPGQLVGIRLICEPKKEPQKATCVILASESGECMRLEAGGMASMELLEEVVPIQSNSVEMDVARLLSSSRDSNSPLLSAAAPIASKLLNLVLAEKESFSN